MVSWLLTLAATAAAARPALAQTMRGRVFLTDSATIASGVVVEALDTANVVVQRALSTASGAYALRFPAPGRYQLRVRRIGFAPMVVPPLDLALGEDRSLDLVLRMQPVALVPFATTGRNDCGLRGVDGQRFLQMIEQARTALAASQLVQSSERLDVRLVRLTGVVIALGSTPEIDSSKAEELVATDAFPKVPLDVIVREGYIRWRADSSLLYDLPHPDHILSDAFIAQHCFSLERDGPSGHADWIGLSFSPVRNVDALADIQGTLWLTRATAELARLEFRYTNVQRALALACDPSRDVRSAVCNHLKTANRAGGLADFLRLPTGEWFMSNWTIRTPAEEARITGSRRVRVVGRRVENCYYKVSTCRVLYSGTDFLGATSYTVSTVLQDGDELYRDDAALTLVATNAIKRAGKRPAAVAGVVMDADGHPIPRAIVQMVDPARVAITDDAGAFAIGVLPADSVTVRVRRAGYESVAFQLRLVPDAVRRIQLTLNKTEGGP